MVDQSLPSPRSRRYFWFRPSRSLLPPLRFARTAEGSKPDSAANVRNTVVAMLIAFAVFFVFESEGIRHFARDLPGNAATDLMVRAADGWHALMERLGPAHVQPAVREQFERIRYLRW
jgi:hypothetical protein